MRYLTRKQAITLYLNMMARTGGSAGIRDLGGLEAALAQPRMTFGGEDLYPTLAEKAAALGFSLVMNHPFVDGNKRAGHLMVEQFLALNGYEIDSAVDEQERVILRLAAGELSREEWTTWLEAHLKPVRNYHDG